MQRKNRVVLMLSGSIMLSGVVGGAISFGWEAMTTLRRQSASAGNQVLPDLVPGFGAITAAPDSINSSPPTTARRTNFTQPRKPGTSAPRFSIVPLDTQIGDTTFYPVALNNKGDVLGGVMLTDGGIRQRFRLDAYLYRQNTLTRIAPLPGFKYSWPMAMNNIGQVIAIAYEPVDSQQSDVRQAALAPLLPGDKEERNYNPFLLDNKQTPTRQQPNRRIVLWEQGVTRDLKMAEQFAARGMSKDVLDTLSRVRIGLNDHGRITLVLDSLYWWAEGKLHLVGGRVPMAAPLLPLNNQNVLVRPSIRALAYGYDRWDRSAQPTTNLPPEWYDIVHQREEKLSANEVWDMNDKSEVLCSSIFAGPQPARQFFVVDRRGKRRRIAVLPSFAPTFINNKGQVVGLSARINPVNSANLPRSPNHGPQQGPFWFENERLYDVNDLLPTNSGWTILQVRDFNDRGEILAYAVDAQRKPHPVLLRPNNLILQRK